MNFLEKIIYYKNKEINEKKKKITLKELKSEIALKNITKDFKNAINKSSISIIAEIKKASPSVGIIRNNFNPINIAKIYEKNGADVLSILTEEKYFKGKLSYIQEISDIVSLPILRKDFIISSYQIYESRRFGADAVLLIANILPLKKIKKFLEISHSLGMSCLVEVHNKRDLEKALKSNAEIIGINNRDLKTFEINLKTTFELIKNIPSDKIVVSESGIKTYQEIISLEKVGVKAVLIGEILMRAKDIGKKLRELKGMSK